ncbi:MAG: O-antigen ligase family protein [Chloroflexi bacterium]|nr:O-antigen ligase family protein [Chloroflexota bacterium]
MASVQTAPHPDSWIKNSEQRRQMLRVLLVACGALIAIGGSAAVGAIANGWLVVLGGIAAIMGLLMVLRPSFGMTVLIVFVYMDLSNLIEVNWGIPSLNKLLVALIFVGVIGTRALVQRRPIVLRSVEGAVLFYGFIIAVSSYVNGEVDTAFDQLIDFAKDFAIVLILVQLCDSEVVWKRMQWAIIISAGFLAMLTCYQMLTGDTTNDFFGLAKAPVHQIVEGFDNTRPTGPLDDPNFYAQILLMVYPLAAYRVLDEKRLRAKGLALLCTLLIVGAIIFTYSRSAFMMILIISALIVLERRMNVYKIAALAGVVLLVALPILPQGYLDRMATITGSTSSAEGQTELSFRGRSSEMIVAMQMFSTHPLLGIGYSAYEEHYLTYSIHVGLDNRLENRQAHSLYLEAAAETGIVGLAAFVFMYLMVFRSLWIARKQLIRIGRSDLVLWLSGLQFGLMGYLMTSIFLHDDYVRYLRLAIGLAISASALTEALVRRYESARTHEMLTTSPTEGLVLADK